MAPILIIDSLSFHYGKHSEPVFSNLNLRVDKGEFVAVVGGSGVGKSTLLKCVADLADSSAGSRPIALEYNDRAFHDLRWRQNQDHLWQPSQVQIQKWQPKQRHQW